MAEDASTKGGSAVVRRKVRFVLEGWWEGTPGSDAYPEAATDDDCLTVDRRQFMEDDWMLALECFDAEPVAIEWVATPSTSTPPVTEETNEA